MAGIPEFGVKSQSPSGISSAAKFVENTELANKWSCNTIPKVTWANVGTIWRLSREAARERERESYS